MEIKIKLTKHEVAHLASPHTFYDSCGEADDVLRKIQKEIDKKYTPPKRRMNKAEKKLLDSLKPSQKTEGDSE